MKTAASFAQWFNMEVARAARAAHAEMMRATAGGPGSTELYLYFKRGALTFAADRPEGFTLGAPERLPTSFTADQCVAWTHTRATSLPCLPNE